jgi:hypothetical protein
VLNIGNKLNTAGSGQRKANAFTLESLLKLGQAKFFDKKTTVLDYVVLVVCRNNEFLTRFSDDLPTVFMASKIHWEQCLADLDEVESQLENRQKLTLLEYRYRDSGGITDTFSPEIVVDGPPLSLEQEYEALRSSKVGQFTLDTIKKVSLRDKVETLQDQYRSPSNTVNDAGIDNCENINTNNENLYRKKGDLQYQFPGDKSESANDRASSISYATNDKKELGCDQSHADLSPLKKENAKTNYKKAIPRWQSPKDMQDVHDDSESIVVGSKKHDTNFNQIASPVKTKEILQGMLFCDPLIQKQKE